MLIVIKNLNDNVEKYFSSKGVSINQLPQKLRLYICSSYLD